MDKNGKLVIVGVNASHDASAVVLVDGKVVSGIQLERLTGIKHDGEHYLSSDRVIDYCLEAAGLTHAEVDYFAFNIQPVGPGYVGLSHPTHSTSFKSFDPFAPTSIFVSHHLAHAFSAYATSGQEASLCVVADGCGGSVVRADDLILTGDEFAEYLSSTPNRYTELHSISVYRMSPSGYELVDRESGRSFNVECGSSTIGETYAAVANYIFGSYHRAGKVMGLAPYGNLDAYPSFLDDSTPPRFTFNWKNDFRNGSGRADWRENVDLAARMQADFETAMVERFELYAQTYAPEAVCYVGGSALNCSANQKIRDALAGLDLHIPSAPNDSGVALGCAFAAHFKLTGSIPRERMTHDFWGRDYDLAEIREAIYEHGEYVDVRHADESDIAVLLFQQKTVGVFQGGAEFGARALGHRSIMADARFPEMWKKINADVKFREDFRPFAPVCRIEDVAKIFSSSLDHPFMVETVTVKPEWRERLGAVTHLDHTARVQTVSADSPSIFHSVIEELYKRTDVPVIVNTSLNVRSKPIAETPQDAMEVLLGSGLDYLYFPDLKKVVSKKESVEPNIWKIRPRAKMEMMTTDDGLAVRLSGCSLNYADAPVAILPFIERLIQGDSIEAAEEAGHLRGSGKDLVGDLTAMGFLLAGVRNQAG